MKAARALELLSHATDLARRDGCNAELYGTIDAALDELVGYKLLTILRLEGSRLTRLHSSDLASYNVGGWKDITHDEWLRTMLADGAPVISPEPSAIRERFMDHETIFALGCGAAMNVPITCPAGTLGSLNLLHETGWFAPEHCLLARPFATLLAAVWAWPALHCDTS